ncbi:hypothetical protein ES703_34279 [subsurface metagenome]
MKLALSGYKVSNICKAFDVPRSSYYYHQNKMKGEAVKRAKDNNRKTIMPQDI